jgi:trans-feruloyl-CoA hydratase/vanillin synthase
MSSSENAEAFAPPVAADQPVPQATTVQVEFEDGIAWVTLNRPDKRNAMSPTLNREMIDILDQLEVDPRCWC